MLKRMASVVLAATMVAAMGCSTTGEKGGAETAAGNAGRVVDDSVITGKVKAALIADSTTKAHQIEVETFKGTVQLSGFVDNAAAKSRATELARQVEGVHDVKNTLELRSKS